MITEDKGGLDVDTSVFVIKQEIYKCIKYDLENGSELSKVLSKIYKLIDGNIEKKGIDIFFYEGFNKLLIRCVKSGNFELSTRSLLMIYKFSSIDNVSRFLFREGFLDYLLSSAENGVILKQNTEIVFDIISNLLPYAYFCDNDYFQVFPFHCLPIAYKEPTLRVLLAMSNVSKEEATYLKIVEVLLLMSPPSHQSIRFFLWLYYQISAKSMTALSMIFGNNEKGRCLVQEIEKTLNISYLSQYEPFIQFFFFVDKSKNPHWINTLLQMTDLSDLLTNLFSTNSASNAIGIRVIRFLIKNNYISVDLILEESILEVIINSFNNGRYRSRILLIKLLILLVINSESYHLKYFANNHVIENIYDIALSNPTTTTYSLCLIHSILEKLHQHSMIELISTESLSSFMEEIGELPLSQQSQIYYDKILSFLPKVQNGNP